MARERWPKARKSSGANQRALRSICGVVLWTFDVMLGTCLERRAAHPTPARRGASLLAKRHLHDNMHMEPEQLRLSPASNATKSRLAKDARFGTIPATCR